MRWILVAVFVITAGCAGRRFTDLGNGVGIPTKSITEYADAHGMTPEQARTTLRRKMDAESAVPK